MIAAQLCMRLCVPAIVAIVVVAAAQAEDTPHERPKDEVKARYQSGYGDAPGFGGPASVSEELRESNETRSSIYQFDSLQRTFVRGSTGSDN